MSTIDPQVLQARAYLLRVAEPPAAALAAFVLARGPVEAAARVREGAVPEAVARETAARRTIDRVAADLEAGHACGARLLTPEHPEWPHWAFAAFDRAAFGAASARALAGASVGAPRGPVAPRGVSDEPVVGTGEAPARCGAAARSSTGRGGGGPAVSTAHAGWRTGGATVGGGGRRPVAAQTEPGRADLAPPLALWVRGPGVLAALADRSAAIVGARAATGYGLHVAGELGVGLAAAGFTVVSGAAIGVDGAAHRGALAGGGATIAVLACGADRSYPAAHEALLERVVVAGLVVSEYPPGAVPARHRFLVRNRLIAGIGGGTVVVEAGLRSGAQRTAADARALGRPVMGVPGPVTSGRSAGSHRLIQEGATLVTRVEEVLEEVGRIGEHLARAPEDATVRPTDGLGPTAALVHDALPARAACAISWLATEAGVPPGAVRAALVELARRGLVEHRGGRWQRTVTTGA